MTERQKLNINPERIKGEQVANLVKQVFDKYPFEITQHLVDSNVVLTFAGLKGQAEFFMDVPDSSNDEMIIKGVEDLNCRLQEIDPDLLMRLEGDPFIGPIDKKRTMMAYVLNLSTLEEWISKSRLCYFPSFDKSKGFEGYDKWKADVIQKFGSDSDEEEMAVGVRKGYPDQAVLDYIDWLKTGREKEKKDANILHTGIYEEAEPIYSFYPKHANDPEIVDNVHKSSEVLEGFYESQWHRNIAQKLVFKKGRNSENKK